MTRHPTRGELELYVLGAAEGRAAAAVEEHCASCDACAERLAQEALLEIAFEQVAKRASRASVCGRPLRAAVYGAAGVLAMAAAAVLWFGRAPLGAGEGAAASGVQASAADGAPIDGQEDALDGG